MTATKPLVVIAAGGTGGHMFPAQAFADEMRARGWAIALVTAGMMSLAFLGFAGLIRV